MCILFYTILQGRFPDSAARWCGSTVMAGQSCRHIAVHKCTAQPNRYGSEEGAGWNKADCLVSSSNGLVQSLHGWSWPQWSTASLLSRTPQMQKILQIHILVPFWGRCHQRLHTFEALHRCAPKIIEFRLTLAKGLIGDYYSRKRPGRGTATPHTLPIWHFPVRKRKIGAGTVPMNGIHQSGGKPGGFVVTVKSICVTLASSMAVTVSSCTTSSVCKSIYITSLFFLLIIHLHVQVLMICG